MWEKIYQVKHFSLGLYQYFVRYYYSYRTDGSLMNLYFV